MGAQSTETDSAGASVGLGLSGPGQSPSEHPNMSNVRSACVSRRGKVQVRDGEQREVTKETGVGG